VAALSSAFSAAVIGYRSTVYRFRFDRSQELVLALSFSPRDKAAVQIQPKAKRSMALGALPAFAAFY